MRREISARDGTVDVRLMLCRGMPVEGVQIVGHCKRAYGPGVPFSNERRAMGARGRTELYTGKNYSIENEDTNDAPVWSGEAAKTPPRVIAANPQGQTGSVENLSRVSMDTFPGPVGLCLALSKRRIGTQPQRPGQVIKWDEMKWTNMTWGQLRGYK